MGEDKNQNVEEIEQRVDPVLKGFFTIPPPPEKPRLIGNRCRKCGEYFFPKRVFCPRCYLDDTLEEAHLGPYGKLYIYCVVRTAPMGFEAPYGLGYVDLSEGPRIYSMLEGRDYDNLEIGTEMELVIGQLRTDNEGSPVYGYKFKPVNNKV